MAKVHKRGTTLLVALYSQRGGVLKAVRSDGHLIRRKSGQQGHMDAGRCKMDATVGWFADRWTAQAHDGEFVRIGLGVDRNHVPNPERAQVASVAARAKRMDKATREREQQRADEAALGLPNEAADLATMTDAIVPFIAARIGRTSSGRFVDGRLAYIADMARWNAGCTGGNLTLAMTAQWRLPRGYAHRESLDTIADAVAEARFGRGSSLNAARRWDKALHG